MAMIRCEVTVGSNTMLRPTNNPASRLAPQPPLLANNHDRNGTLSYTIIAVTTSFHRQRRRPHAPGVGGGGSPVNELRERKRRPLSLGNSAVNFMPHRLRSPRVVCERDLLRRQKKKVLVRNPRSIRTVPVVRTICHVKGLVQIAQITTDKSVRHIAADSRESSCAAKRLWAGSGAGSVGRSGIIYVGESYTASVLHLQRGVLGTTIAYFGESLGRTHFDFHVFIHR